MKRVLLDDPTDYLGLRGKKLKTIFLGSLVIGALSLGLWNKLEQVAFGQQRLISYVGHSHHRPDIILSATVFLTSGSSFDTASTLPGWNPSSNWVDCIGGGGGGPNQGTYPAAGGGGGGGGWVRYTNMGALPATVSYSIGGGGNLSAGGATTFNASTIVANGGGLGTTGAGGVGGTWAGGTAGRSGGAGGNPNNSTAAGGGGGGAAGPNANGNGGGTSGSNSGAAGGAGDGGSGGGGGAGGVWPSGPNAGAGGAGTEYGSGVGCGGGGGGGGNANAGRVGGAGGLYGGGGGGAGSVSGGGAGANGIGAQGLIVITYTPLAAPTVSSCAPNTGPAAGGTSITITGTGFVSVTGVTVGGNAATGVAVVNPTTITCVTPAHPPGIVSVVVSNSGGSGTGTNVFTYLAAAGGFNIPMAGV
jgi:hypothetical protein